MNSKNKNILPKRPQEPLRPYPYHEEEVAFDNKVAGVRLAGTFTMPQGPGPFPAVLLIAGSGPHARDAIKCGHKTMLVLADHLTRHGIAVLRFDKRGCGDSTGNFETATTIDFAGDAQAGIEYLKSRQAVNQEQIGLIGHSEGGIIASMIAAERVDLAFVILMASTGVNGEEVLLEQCALLARASGETDEAVITRRQLLSRMCSCIHEYPDVAVARKHIHDVYERYANSLLAD